MVGRIDAVVFDLDGTLADTFDLLLAAFNAAGRPPGAAPLTRAEMVAHFGPGAGTEAAILATLLERTDDADFAAFREVYTSEHAARCQLFPGLHEALLRARARGWGIGLLTGKGRLTTEITLRELGVAACFDAIMTGDEALAPKPDPRGLLLVLDQLGVAAARVLFIGDSEADIGAGRAAGTLTAAALWNNPGDPILLATRPDYVLHTGDDLLALLDELAAG